MRKSRWPCNAGYKSIELVGVRLDVIQSSDVRVHYGFPGNRLASMTKLRVLFMKRVFSYSTNVEEF